jgi:hypothetical protein
MILPRLRVEQLIDGLVLIGLLLTVAVLPLQEFSLQFATGMCLTLLFFWGIGAVVRERLVVVWTRLHSTLLVFLGVVILQLIPWPFDRIPWRFDHTFEGLPVALDHWRAFSIDPQTTAQAGMVLASLVGFFFLTVNLVNSEKRLRLMVNGLILIGVTLTLVGILDKFSPTEEPLLRRANAVGLFYYSLGLDTSS